MAMLKYATSEIISAEIAGDSDLRKSAAKSLGASEYIYHEGLYKPAHRMSFSDVNQRPGYLYVRNRAISSRTNDNWDTWPAEEIADRTPGFGYLTFIGKPVFVEHANDNHRRTRGVNIAAALHEDHTPQGHPDTWVEVLKEVDPVAYPKLAKALVTGRINRTSMGADVGYSVCSKCGNKAFATTEYCRHIPAAKGARYEVPNQKTGSKETRIVTEICRKIAFFEDTFIVTTPADPTAYILGVDGEGVTKAAAVEAAPPQRERIQVSAAQRPEPVEASAPIEETMLHQAIKEITLPPQVDTLSHDVCPTCGSENSFVGDRCSVCNGMKPPENFMDPDTSVAPKIQEMIDTQMGGNTDPNANLAELAEQQPPDLVCDNCGKEFFSAESEEEMGNPYLAPAANTVPESVDAENDELMAEQDETQMGEERFPDEPDLEPEDDEDQNQVGPNGEIPEEDEQDPGAQEDDEQQPQGKDQDIPGIGDEPEGDDEGAEDAEDQAEAGQEDEDDPELDQEGRIEAEVAPATPEEEAEADLAQDEAGQDITGYAEGDTCPACGKGELVPVGSVELGNDDDLDGDPSGEAGDEEAEDEPPFAKGAEDGDEEDPGEDPEAPEEAEDDPDDSAADDESGPPEDEDDEEDEEPNRPAPSRHKGAVVMTTGQQTGKRAPARKADPVRQAINTQATRIRELSEKVASLTDEREEMFGAFSRQSEFVKRQAALIQTLQVRNETLERQMSYVAKAAGLDEGIVAIGKAGYQKVASILAQAGLAPKRANPANPAQPIAEPGSEAPVVTEQQAMQPEARDDVTQLGASPLTDVSADATVAVDQPYGVYADTPVGVNRVDVTAPVAGTETQRPPSETIIPVDVRIGDPDNPNPAFPWTMGPVGSPGNPTPPGPSVGNPPVTASNGQKRAFACLHLAKLQIEAGIATGDELEVAASLDVPERSDVDIQKEIVTLSKVREARKSQTMEVPEVGSPGRRLVPRTAAASQSPYPGNEPRSTPSMASMVNASAPKPVGASPVEDEMAFI